MKKFLGCSLLVIIILISYFSVNKHIQKTKAKNVVIEGFNILSNVDKINIKGVILKNYYVDITVNKSKNNFRYMVNISTNEFRDIKNNKFNLDFISVKTDQTENIFFKYNISNDNKKLELQDSLLKIFSSKRYVHMNYDFTNKYLGSYETFRSQISNTLVVNAIDKNKNGYSIRAGFNKNKLLKKVDQTNFSNINIINSQQQNLVKKYINSYDNWDKDILFVDLNKNQQITRINLYLPSIPKDIYKGLIETNKTRNIFRILSFLEEKKDQKVIEVLDLEFDKYNNASEISKPNEYIDIKDLIVSSPQNLLEPTSIFFKSIENTLFKKSISNPLIGNINHTVKSSNLDNNIRSINLKQMLKNIVEKTKKETPKLINDIKKEINEIKVQI